MPLVLWPVQPDYLYRNNKLTNDPDALRAQRLHGLTNILRQLSSISLNIEDIFVGISADIESIQLRSQEISNRVQRLREITKKTINVESTLDPNLKEWSMNIKIGAPTVARNTLPEPIEKLYNSCVAMPQLEKLDRFNQDNIKCMNSYSKPEFFFEQWITSFDKDIAIKQEKKMKKREDRKAAKVDKEATQPTPTAEITKPTADDDDKSNISAIPKQPSTGAHVKEPSLAPPPPVAPPVSSKKVSVSPSKALAPPSLPGKSAAETDSTYQFSVSSASQELAPSHDIMDETMDIIPPDIAPLEINQVSKAGAVTDESVYKINEVKAPAPPPPPPVAILKVSKPTPPPPKSPGVSAPQVSAAPKPASSGGQMDLLSAIRMGKELKTVKPVEKKEVEQFAGNDVASILARRIQLAGDSDSDSSEAEDDTDDWD